MPIYEFECEKCGHVFERFCRAACESVDCGNALSNTDKCAGRAKRILSAPAIVYKKKYKDGG